MKHNVHAILLAVISATLPFSRNEAAVPTPDEVRSIAAEGYIYGLPLVMSYVANYQFWLDKESGQYKCLMNQLNHERRTFTDKDTAVIVPNSDTPYSFTCLDLRAEPFVITVPEVGKERYYSVQLRDWNTFNLASQGILVGDDV